MQKVHPENERLKRRYLQRVRYAKGKSETSIDQIAAAIDRFQAHTSGKPFRKFHIEQVISFKQALEKETNQRTGKPLAATTRRSILLALKAFFEWLADLPGFGRRITYSDCEYFRPDNRTTALSNARPPVDYPSVEQIEYVLRTMPSGTPAEIRNRAIIAFCLITAGRISAINSAKIRNVDMIEEVFIQDATDVWTKFSKSFETTFFRISEIARNIFREYVAWLIEEQKFGPGDPLFPKNQVVHVPGRGFQTIGLAREHWKSTNSLRGIVKPAFENAGIRYYHPHSFRHTVAAIGYKRCKTGEQQQSWAQNLGHEHVMTMFQNYGKISRERQREVIRSLKD